jgi:hypothetical protein
MLAQYVIMSCIFGIIYVTVAGPEQVRACGFGSYCLFLYFCSSSLLLLLPGSVSPYLQVFFGLQGKAFNLLLAFFVVSLGSHENFYCFFGIGIFLFTN